MLLCRFQRMLIMDHNLIENLSFGKTGRKSSWDRTGGNADFMRAGRGETLCLGEIVGPGKITHIWLAGPYDFRDTLLKITWDDCDKPSILAPVGDFFGQGNCFVNSYQSQWFTSSTNTPNQQHGRSALNCYIPMPFKKKAKVELVCETGGAIYYYLDYETYEDEKHLGANPGYLHAEFRMAQPFGGWGARVYPNSPESDRIVNLKKDAWNNNYVIFEGRGRGHYVGCFFNVANLRATAFERYGDGTGYAWWGEGDDMIWVDGYKWPPDLHGTGAEDYFGHSYGMQRNAFLRNGTTIHEFDTKGYSTSYVFHIENPVRFQKEIKATIEVGHGNHLGLGISSVAYIYMEKPTGVIDVPSKEIRRPIGKKDGQWNLAELKEYASTKMPVNDSMKLDLIQWDIKANARNYFQVVGKLEKDRGELFLFKLYRDFEGKTEGSFKDFLLKAIGLDEGVSKLRIDILGYKKDLAISQVDEIFPKIEHLLKEKLGKALKLLAGDIKLSENGEVVRIVHLHSRVTFRDAPLEDVEVT